MRKLFICLLILLLTCSCALADTVWTNPETGFSFRYEDTAELITDPSEIQDVQEAMKAVTAYANVIFYTSHSVGSDYEKAARTLGNQTFGPDKKWSMFFIDMKHRQLVVANSPVLERVITSGDCNTITDNVYRDAGRGQYSISAVKAFNQITTLLRGGRIAEPMKYISSILIGILLGVGATFVTLNSTRDHRRKKQIQNLAITTVTVGSAAILGSHLVRTISHSSGGSGGGGFGGGGSSGGGGGFSGGSSGSHGF